MRTHKSSFSSSTKLLEFELTKFKRMFVVRMWSVDNLSGVFVVMMVLVCPLRVCGRMMFLSKPSYFIGDSYITENRKLVISFYKFHIVRFRNFETDLKSRHDDRRQQIICIRCYGSCYKARWQPVQREMSDELCAHYNYIHSHSHAKCMGIWNQHRHSGSWRDRQFAS